MRRCAQAEVFVALQFENPDPFFHVQREVALEVQEREKLLLKKEALRRQLEMQLEEALARKLRAEPAMTQTEREINADMLRRMYAAEIATASQPGTI